MNSTIDIVYIVSSGFASRMVTQTNLLGLIAKSGYKVALIAPDKNDENLVQYCTQNNIVLYEFTYHIPFISDQFYESRKYFLENIEANPALWEKHVLAMKKNFLNNPVSFVRTRSLLFFYFLIKRFPFIRGVYKNVEKLFLISISAKKLINSIKPKIVVSTYPVNFTEAVLLKESKKIKGSTSIIHLLSWDNITCKGAFPQLSERFIVWGDMMKDELIEYYGISENVIHKCGVPHFDIHALNKGKDGYKKILVNLGLNPELPYLVFGMSSARIALKEIDIVEWLANKIEENVFGEKTQLVIRPHPQNIQGNMADLSWIPRLEKLNGSRVKVDFPNIINSKMPYSMILSDMDVLSKLLCGALAVINSGSTLSIDALMCNKPVILISFDGYDEMDYWNSIARLNDYTHLRKFTSFGGARISKNFSELTSHISECVNNPEVLLSERTKTLQYFCNSTDGKSTESVLKQLISIIKDVKS